jgi:hypothetical protein
MKTLLAYLKHFNAPKHKDVSELALMSWREYIKGKARIYDMDFCRAYQRAFISAYRDSYAKAQIKSELSTNSKISL